MACVLPQLMSQPSMSSLDFLPRSALMDWGHCRVVYSKWNGVQWNGEMKFSESLHKWLQDHNLNEALNRFAIVTVCVQVGHSLLLKVLQSLIYCKCFTMSTKSFRPLKFISFSEELCRHISTMLENMSFSLNHFGNFKDPICEPVFKCQLWTLLSV